MRRPPCAGAIAIARSAVCTRPTCRGSCNADRSPRGPSPTRSTSVRALSRSSYYPPRSPRGTRRASRARWPRGSGWYCVVAVPDLARVHVLVPIPAAQGHHLGWDARHLVTLSCDPRVTREESPMSRSPDAQAAKASFPTRGEPKLKRLETTALAGAPPPPAACSCRLC